MLRTLCFDIGGSAVKAMLFDELGTPLTQRARMPTPHSATPKAILGVMQSITELPQIKGRFERVSAGFPGTVKNGKTLNAPNLGPGWKNFSLQKALEEKFKLGVRVANDADVHGLGASRGMGLELTITLGTGVGSALVSDGILIPNLELGHLPFRHGDIFEEQLGRAALDRIGKKLWNARVRKMIKVLFVAFNFDNLYIGGGNAKHVTGRLPSCVRLISNEAGLAGGIKLWHPNAKVERSSLRAARPESFAA